MAVKGTTALLILLLTVGVFLSYVVSSPQSGFDNSRVGNSQSSSTVHNVTVDCGNYGVLNRIGSQCYRDLIQLASRGYPWSGGDNERHSRNNPNVADRNNTLGDSLDTLNHVCYIHDKSQTCLEENGIHDYCVATMVDGRPALQWIFSLSVIISGAMRT